MSYLDLPRIHFGGKFQASPSTINNTPNNFDPSRWPTTGEPDLPTDKIELYWSPQGNGIFDLINCSVTSVVSAGGNDALTGNPVSAVYTKAPPKLVDLDPMQQNVSEVWGLLLQIGDLGGAFVRGTFEPVAFNGIWANAQGLDAPRSSASGSAVFQSTLTNLAWQNPAGAKHSAVLDTLKALAEKNVSKRYPDPRLSVRLVVNAHNNIPETYLFDDTTFAKMAAAGVPQTVTDRLQVLASLRQMLTDPKDFPPGAIPTLAYVNFLLKDLLGEQTAKQYRAAIVAATKQPYQTVMTTEFNHGLLLGTLGPAGPDEPRYAVPARTLAPPAKSPCFFAPFQLRGQTLTVDLGNSLPVKLPGRPPWADQLGELSLQCGTDFSASVDYSGDLLSKRSGVLDIALTADQAELIAQKPLQLVGTPAGTATVLLQENSEGLSLRADQFVFRMNPGVETSPTSPRGKTVAVEIHVRQFGEIKGAAGRSIQLKMMDEQDAINYTKNTLGTSGTAGLENLSIPQNALTFSSATATVGPDGVARFELNASNPGNPRKYVDGQIYFVTYSLTEPPPDYIGDLNDLLSVQVYQDTQIENPTWDNGIAEILTQFGRLYPVMAQFGLSDHASVKTNASMIRSVLEREMPDPLHMPVTRDLSDSRCRLVLDWMNNGMP